MIHSKILSTLAISFRSLIVGAFAAAPLAVAGWTPAIADTITVSYNGGYFSGDPLYSSGYVTLSTLTKSYGTPAVSGGAAAGADNISATDQQTGTTLNNLEAWCVDVTHYLNTSPDSNFTIPSDGGAAYFASIYGANGQDVINRLNVLASNTLAQGQVNSAATSAAFQLAVWDIVYDNPNIPGGGFAAYATDANVNSEASLFLTETSHPIDVALTTYLNSPTDSQTLITFAPVPLPATAWLLLSGLAAGMRAMPRRRRV